jgi:hypothetical protein
LREMLPEDLPRVMELAKEQNERDGTSYAPPDVFDFFGARLPSIPLALVACDVESGEVVQAHIYERTIEGMTFGVNSTATVCSMHECESVFFLLRQRGYKDLHILVPPQRAPQMEHGLNKMLGMTDTGLRHFYRLLDPDENDALRAFHETQEVKV